MQIFIDTRKLSDYELFLKVKKLPRYRVQGHTVIFPDEYTDMLGMGEIKADATGYEPESFLFDYQSAITGIALAKRKFAVFAQCGLGKCLISLSYARHVSRVHPTGRILLVAPLMVCEQTIGEAKRFWGGDYPIEYVPAKRIQKWMNGDTGAIGITNYEAIRTRTLGLQFAGLKRDRAGCRGATGMYLIKLRAPGDNEDRINGEDQVSNNDWIDWAEAAWKGIYQTDTLNPAEGKGEDDTKHICPMQLGIYERVIRLYSDPGELVFDPFTGIGSCGYVCLGGESRKTKRRLKDKRRFVGCELKPEYIAAAKKNFARALAQKGNRGPSLFGDSEDS